MRRRKFFFWVLLLLILLGVFTEILLWQPFLRVQTVSANGPHATELREFVLQELSGTVYYILPKNSIFFLPEQKLRDEILARFADIEAVSIAPANLTTLSVASVGRTTSFWWCGLAIASPSADCYQSDLQGLIFSLVPFEDALATSSVLKLYAPVASSTEATTSPLGGIILHAPVIPGVMQFVKAMKTLGANVVSVELRGDEADLYTLAGTRITYVTGREREAAELAASAFPSLNLNDGSLLYVDLRFSGKAFFKKKVDVTK